MVIVDEVKAFGREGNEFGWVGEMGIESKIEMPSKLMIGYLSHRPLVPPCEPCSMPYLYRV